MGTDDRYAQPVARAKWTPDEPELEQRLDRLVALHQQLEQVETEYKAALATLAKPNGPVPIAYLAERLGVVRKTVYRHLGRSMT
jgi:transcriptional regulator of acetoin/glycerol metabolism